MHSLENVPFGARAGNALISYCRYLGKLFWPTDLAVFYPYPDHWPLDQVLLAGGLMAGVSAFVFVQRARHPYLLTGWLWFCGTLVPVIGLVQVGGQAMADRYTYIPSLGLFILAVWGAYELARRWRYHEMALWRSGLRGDHSVHRLDAATTRVLAEQTRLFIGMRWRSRRIITSRITIWGLLFSSRAKLTRRSANTGKPSA